RSARFERDELGSHQPQTALQHRPDARPPDAGRPALRRLPRARRRSRRARPRALRGRLALLGLARRVRRAPTATPLRSGLPLRARARPTRRRTAGRQRRAAREAATLRSYYPRIEPDALNRDVL